LLGEPADQACFTKAAAELNVTQPAVSRMLARLENHLGVKLFARPPTGVMPSEDGKQLYEHISGGFRSIEAGFRELDIRRGGAKTVALSLSPDFTTHWLMTRIKKFQKEFPAVELHFQLIPAYLGGTAENVDLSNTMAQHGDGKRFSSNLVCGGTDQPLPDPQAGTSAAQGGVGSIPGGYVSDGAVIK
jgi:DNA-binding transcriptional LysR family regulator